MIVEVKEPDVITKIEISEETKEELKSIVFEEGQVVVHCVFPASSEDFAIRIWPTTFLIDAHSSHKSTLIHHEGISLFPQWTIVEPNTTKKFTLLFSRLPSTCTSFNLVEEIPQEGGFFVNNIQRNATDVYTVQLG